MGANTFFGALKGGNTFFVIEEGGDESKFTPVRIWIIWQHIFVSLKRGGQSNIYSNKDLASRRWIIGLEEADHLHQKTPQTVKVPLDPITARRGPQS